MTRLPGAPNVDSPSTHPATSFNLDRGVAAGAIGIYTLAVVALLPTTTFAHMLGGAFIYFGAIATVACLLGPRSTHAFSIYAVSVAGMAVLLMPNFPAMGGEHPIGVPLGFLASQAGALLWVSLRWDPDPRPKPPTCLLEALLAGIFGAVGLSLIASIPIGIGLLAGAADMKRMLWVYPAYFAGALSAAFLYWLLQRIAHRPVGRYVIGALGGFCLYGAVGPVVAVFEGEPLDLREIAMIGTVAGMLVGPPVAMSLNEESAL